MSEANTVLDQLHRASDRYEDARQALEPHDPADIERVVETLRDLDRILETYEDRATGSGDYGGYIEFRSTIESFVENLPSDLPERDAFEQMGERVDKRRLSTKDFDAAREAVTPARDLVERLDDCRHAAKELQTAKTTTQHQIETVEKRIEEVDRLLEIAELDLDAPVNQVREPIETYNDAVASAFDSYLRTADAAEVLELYARGRRFPLVDIPRPPAELYTYVSEHVPELTVHDLLEYADYSSSKLGHFVDNPQQFRAAVATERTFLQEIGATHFQIGWPPPPADQLHWQLRELQSIVSRFSTEAVIESLRAVESLTRDSARFAHLREVAVALDSVDETDRQRIASGELPVERERFVAQRETLQEALAEAPTPTIR